MVILSTGGCAELHYSAPRYQTVVADPHRDHVMAARKNRLAAIAMEKSNLGKAEQLLQEALLADVQYGPAHNNLGLVYLRTQQLYLAAWEFEYAIQTMGYRAEPHNNLGLVYENAEQLDDAVQNYAAAHEIDPDNPEYIGNLARALLRQDDHDPAAQELISQLLLCDTRPDWLAWAREKLATGKFYSTSPKEPAVKEEAVPHRPRAKQPEATNTAIPEELELPPPTDSSARQPPSDSAVAIGKLRR